MNNPLQELCIKAWKKLEYNFNYTPLPGIETINMYDPDKIYQITKSSLLISSLIRTENERFRKI